MVSCKNSKKLFFREMVACGVAALFNISVSFADPKSDLEILAEVELEASSMVNYCQSSKNLALASDPAVQESLSAMHQVFLKTISENHLDVSNPKIQKLVSAHHRLSSGILASLLQEHEIFWISLEALFLNWTTHLRNQSGDLLSPDHQALLKAVLIEIARAAEFSLTDGIIIAMDAFEAEHPEVKIRQVEGGQAYEIPEGAPLELLNQAKFIRSTTVALENRGYADWFAQRDTQTFSKNYELIFGQTHSLYYLTNHDLLARIYYKLRPLLRQSDALYYKSPLKGEGNYLADKIALAGRARHNLFNRHLNRAKFKVSEYSPEFNLIKKEDYLSLQSGFVSSFSWKDAPPVANLKAKKKKKKKKKLKPESLDQKTDQEENENENKEEELELHAGSETKRAPLLEDINPPSAEPTDVAAETHSEEISCKEIRSSIRSKEERTRETSDDSPPSLAPSPLAPELISDLSLDSIAGSSSAQNLDSQNTDPGEELHEWIRLQKELSARKKLGRSLRIQDTVPVTEFRKPRKKVSPESVLVYASSQRFRAGGAVSIPQFKKFIRELGGHVFASTGNGSQVRYTLPNFGKSGAIKPFLLFRIHLHDGENEVNPNDLKYFLGLALATARFDLVELESD